jgi:hypothetical protein
MTESQAQWAVEWEDEVAVSGADYGNNRPRMVLDDNGNPHVIWGQSSGHNLWYSKFEGSSFTSPMELTQGDQEVFTSDWAGPDIGSGGSSLFVTFKIVPESATGVYMIRSLDGGETWSDTIRVDELEGLDSQSRFPVITGDDSGNPAINFMVFDGNYQDPRYEIMTSQDGGDSFGPLVNASTDLFEGEVCDCCMGDILFRDGRLISLFRGNDENIREIKAVTSTDWGISFDEGFEVDETETYSGQCFSSGPDGVLVNGTLYSTFRATLAGDVRVVLSAYDLNGDELFWHQPVDDSFEGNYSQSDPKVGANDEFILVAWQQGTSLDKEIYMSLLENGSTPNLVSTTIINASSNGLQINPEIVITDDNTVHAVWQDKGSANVIYRKGQVVQAVGVTEPKQKLELRVIPNPSNGNFRVSNPLKEAIQIEVLSAVGKLVLRETIGALETYELLISVPGSYYVRSDHDQIHTSVVTVY